jgi:hypothetical protein
MIALYALCLSMMIVGSLVVAVEIIRHAPPRKHYEGHFGGESMKSWDEMSKQEKDDLWTV